MKIDEVIQKWNDANEIDEFTKIQLAEMLDSAVQYIEQQNAAQQSVQPDVANAVPVGCCDHGFDIYCPVCAANSPRR